MKKQILNIGKALSRAEQKQVFGGVSQGGTCVIRLNGGIWHGQSSSDVEQVKKKMKTGDSMQWCCESCSTASWLN